MFQFNFQTISALPASHKFYWNFSIDLSLCSNPDPSCSRDYRRYIVCSVSSFNYLIPEQKISFPRSQTDVSNSCSMYVFMFPPKSVPSFSLPSKMKPLRCVITSHKKCVHICQQICKTMNDPMKSYVQIWLIWEAKRERRGLSWVGVLHIQDTCIFGRLTATCVFLIFPPPCLSCASCYLQR